MELQQLIEASGLSPQQFGAALILMVFLLLFIWYTFVQELVKRFHSWYVGEREDW